MNQFWPNNVVLEDFLAHFFKTEDDDQVQIPRL